MTGVAEFLTDPAGVALAAAPGTVDTLRYRAEPTLRIVRGSRMRTKAALLDEVSAALQFPLHFGGNWDALADCLTDLDWLGPGRVVLAVAQAEQVAADEPASLAIFAGVLADAVAGTGARLAVLLLTDGDGAAVRSAWAAAGLTPIATD